MPKNMGRPVGNRFRVPVRQWRKWSNHAKGVFNSVYKAMRSQHIYIHPAATYVIKQHWDTIRWNAAWEAACAADGK